MTTALVAALAAVPVLAFSFPFMNGQGNANGHAKVDFKAEIKEMLKPKMKANASVKANATMTGSTKWDKWQKKIDCQLSQLDLVMQKNADLKAYIKAHPIKNRADAKAWVKFRQDLQVKYRLALKDLKAKCKAGTVSSGSSTSSSVNSSVSSNTSVSSGSSQSSTTVSSNSSSTTSSSLSSALSSLASSIQSSLSSNSSVSSQ